MQTPRAHITRQGAVDTIIGAIPTAVSQFQPRPGPAPVTASPATPRTRQSLIHDRSRPPDGCIAKLGAQHDPEIALGTSPVADAAGAGGFVISKLSMSFLLLQRPVDNEAKTSPKPCEDREGVEKPVRQTRQLAGQNGDPHCGDDRACPEMQRPANPTKDSQPHHQALGEDRCGEKWQR